MVNKKQIFVMAIGIALLILAELFPPWNFEDNNTSAQCSAGYHYYQNKPPLKTREELLKCFRMSPDKPSYDGFKISSVGVHENFLRILAQRVIIIFLTSSSMLILRKEKSWQLKILICGLLVAALGIFYLWVNNVQVWGW